MRPIANTLGAGALHNENCLTAGAGPVNPELTTAERDEQRAAVRAVPTPEFLEPVFDGLAQLAVRVCQTSFASIALTGCGKTWCSSGAALPAAALPRHDPFYDCTTNSTGLFEVEDTTLDARFRDAECVTGALAVRSYAGTALRSARGDVLGTLAIYGRAAGQLSPEQRAALTLLAQQGAAHAEGRAQLNELVLLSGLQAKAKPLPIDATLATALIESAPVAIYHIDARSDISYVNPEYRRMFRLTPEQSVNDWNQGVHSDDRARIQEEWADFCRRPRPVRFEYRTAPGQGGVRFFSEQVVVAHGVAGFVGTISDFTDLVTSRGNLRKAETLFRNTFDQAPIGIAYADRNGRFQRCNQAFCALLGFDAGELESRSISDLTYNEDVARTATELERLWSGAIESVDLEKRYTRKDGTAQWVRTTTALVREGNSTPECSVEFLRDISNRKELAAQLLQQQTLLEAVIAELPVALLACNVAGEVTHSNRAAAELHCIQRLGPSAEGSVSRLSAAEVYLPDGITPVSEAGYPLARALRGETVSNLELVIVPRNSTARSTLSSARRLVGPDGQTRGAVAVIQDTTDRKLADLELERVHKQLMTASRQAGMAEVATNVLHNVGNILNSINISASLVAERVKQSKASSVCRVAALLQEKGATLGEFLTNDEQGKRIPEYLASLGEQLVSNQKVALQEFASLRDNLEHIKDTVAMQQTYAKLCGVTEIVEVVDLVEDSLRLNAGAFVRHGVTLRREFSAVPAISVDKHKVLQILVNLIRNAKYACDESGKTEKLITLRVESAVNGVRICVIDNGVGILPENMGRIFNHGFTTRQSGHGFGLHSGALAAQELGGSLRAESEGPGRGAAFILELPCAPRDAVRA
jgi:PAS domain S-box-containing protein